jgi:hypothetical protein
MESKNKPLSKWQKWMITFWPFVVVCCFIRLLFTLPGSHEAEFWAKMCLLTAFGPILLVMIPPNIAKWIRDWWKWINE